MSLPESYKTRKYLLHELIGAIVVLVLLIITLTKGYIRFHWVTDTIWLASIILLTVPELTKDKPLMKYPEWMKPASTSLLFCLYLFLYHFFITVFSLRYIDFECILHAGAATLFGMALYLRASEMGIAIKSFDWKNLFRYPHWPMTVGTILCTLAPFFKMTKINSLSSSYGLQFGYDSNNGWGYNNWGYNYYGITILIKGYLAYWGHFACLLLAFMLVFYIVKAAGNKVYPRLDTFFKFAVPVAIAWWIMGAKGYDALKGFGNILFIAGMILLIFAIYLPDKLGELIRKKGLLK